MSNMKAKNTICLCFNKDAQDAARFYAATFPNSEVTAIHRAPGDFPGGKEGEILTVELTVFGMPCLGLNGGPEFPHTEAFSFQIATDTQGGNGSLLECNREQRRPGTRVRLVQRPVGSLLANHAARVDGRDGGGRP